MHDALVTVPGVTDVAVSFEDRTAVVKGTRCDPDAMIAAIERVGYRAHVR